jgi:hypothetical protein
VIEFKLSITIKQSSRNKVLIASLEFVKQMRAASAAKTTLSPFRGRKHADIFFAFEVNFRAAINRQVRSAAPLSTSSAMTSTYAIVNLLRRHSNGAA